MAKFLEADFPLAIHRRASFGPGDLAALAQELKTTLSRSAIRPPYLLVGHSFGALVIRQYAALYRNDVKGLLFVDGLPPTAAFSPGLLRKAQWGICGMQILSKLGTVGPILRVAKPYSQTVRWAFTELEKYPDAQQRDIRADWNTPTFWDSAARILNHLPANLIAAQHLIVPMGIPTISLHSDYTDPAGRHVGEAGHWIQIDQPVIVANAVRELAAMS